MSAQATTEWIGPASKKTFLGHPIGLFVLFTTEMWERFSYYGMRGLLKLYMVNYLFITIRQTYQGKAYDVGGDPQSVWGWSFIQKFLPTVDPAELSKCVAEKSASLLAGDAVKGIAPVAQDIATTIATQTCNITPNASVLYGWYTGLVYLTPVLGGYLADRYFGQRRSVFIGATLMALGQFVLFSAESLFFVGLILLIAGNGFFKPNISTQVGSLYPPNDPRRDRAFTIFYMGINLGAFLTNLVCGTLAMAYGWRWGFFAAGVGMLSGLLVQALFGAKTLAPDTLQSRQSGKEEAAHHPLTKNEWKRVWALVILCLLNIVFWAVYEQQGNTMQTWADEKTIWPAWMSSTWFQSANPLFIFMLAPLLDIFWAWQNKRGKEPSSVAKMAMGCFILGGSFAVMVAGAQVIGAGKGSWFWPIFCTFLLTFGELYLSPIGLSLVTKVSPVRIVSLMMGMWFLSSFFGNILSGYVGQLYTTMSAEGFFWLLLAMGVGAGIAIWAFNRPLKTAMASDEPHPPAAEVSAQAA